MPETATRHAVGGNRPPVGELLRDQYKELLADLQAWTGSAQRAPAKITDDDTLTKVGLIVSKLIGVISRAKTAHKVEKEPFLSGGREVDGFFNTIMEQAKTIKGDLEGRQGIYIRAKEDAEREKARAAEEAARAEAEAALKLAERAQDRGDFDIAGALLQDAVGADQQANQAAEAVTAKPADLVRAHGEYGNVVSAKVEWKYRITDPRMVVQNAAVLWPLLPAAVVESAIKAFVRLNKDTQMLYGIEIYEDRKVVNKGA